MEMDKSHPIHERRALLAEKLNVSPDANKRIARSLTMQRVTFWLHLLGLLVGMWVYALHVAEYVQHLGSDEADTFISMFLFSLAIWVPLSIQQILFSQHLQVLNTLDVADDIDTMAIDDANARLQHYLAPVKNSLYVAGLIGLFIWSIVIFLIPPPFFLLSALLFPVAVGYLLWTFSRHWLQIWENIREVETALGIASPGFGKLISFR